MTKTLSARSVLCFLTLDVVFNPLVMVAFVQLLGVQRGGGASVFLLFGLVAAKVLCGSAYLLRELRPYEQFERTPALLRSAELVRRADDVLQRLPSRFACFYALTWSATYVGAYFGLAWLRPEELSPRALDAVALVAVAVAFGGFAFAFPLLAMLTAKPAGACSVIARAGKVVLDREPVSLQVRIGVVALALGLGPTLWMMALGYMKQVESSHEQRGMRAALAASELARVSAGTSLPGAGSAQWLEMARDYESQPAEHAYHLIVNERGELVGRAPGEREFVLPADVRDWLHERLARASAGVLSPVHSQRSVAFRKIDARYAAVSVVEAEVRASSSFVFSAGAFALVVAAWAPLCAIVLGRAVSAPIERLTSAATQVVEEGRQSEMGALPSARNDEIGVLTDRFNDLLDLMRDLGAAANAVARGDLRIQIDGKGELPDAFRGMLDSLRRMVQQIAETSVDLGSAATEIFAASQEQEAAATSQSSAMEEISRTMDSLSDSAAHVSEAVQGVLSNAELTLQNTDAMVRRIGELSALAGRIGEILEVIREIADRSDLLALNGSLEASRAGEGGQGFALVAGEMRRLAERVTASVQDVKKLVSDIRESGSSTVMATEESKRLAEGTTEAARQITFVTQQQLSGTEQVSQSIKNIVDVVGQAVSATSQTRTSAEGLKARADRLAELVRRFETLASGVP